MTETQIDILVIVIGFPLFGVGLYLWVKAGKHMLGMMKNVKPKMGWATYIPISIFMPMFFNEIGNIHRVKALKYGGLFILFCATPFLLTWGWEWYEKY